MKYCNNCGKEVSDNAVVCPFCGCAVASKNVEVDKPSTGLTFYRSEHPVVPHPAGWPDSVPVVAEFDPH